MSELRREDYGRNRNDLLTALTIAQERANRGKVNESKKQMYETKVESLDKDIAELTATGNHINSIYRNIKSYNIKHQQKAKDILDLAIEEAGNLVPDADVNGIRLDTKPDGRVSVVNGKGQNVNLREGGGYRAILGALLRYACLKAQPDALQLMIYDEYFFTLSDDTTDNIRPILEAMKKDITIICIEQRRNAMAGIVDTEYTFKKGLDKNTQVFRTI